MSDVRNVIMIGGGPAGYTAALYAARANLEPLVIEGFNWGGQLMITSDVENYPGYADGVMGPAMMQDFRRQAERFGPSSSPTTSRASTSPQRPFRVWVGDDEYRADSVIVATGASARQLGLESELLLQGRGVSYCATCDAAFFRDKVVVVVGGGDSAMEEALFISRFASKVYLVHRREEFRASPIMVDRARANEKIEFVLNKVVEEVLGDGKVTGVRLRDTVTGDETELETDGVLRRDRPRPEHGAVPRPARPRAGHAATCSRGGSRPRPTSPASSPRATCRTTSTARRSPRPAPAARPRSTPSAGSASSGTRRYRPPVAAANSPSAWLSQRRQPGARPRSATGREDGSPSDGGLSSQWTSRPLRRGRAARHRPRRRRPRLRLLSTVRGWIRFHLGSSAGRAMTCGPPSFSVTWKYETRHMCG